MSERSKEDREEAFPEKGFAVESLDGLDEAYRKYNRRKGTPADYTGDKTRRSDRTGESKRGGGSEHGKAIVFGKKKTA